MKKIYLLLLLLFIGNYNAQIINFTDVNFKNFLIGKGIDTNTDNEISQFEAIAVTELIIDNQSITDVTGINYFTGLNTLKFTNNSQVTNLDISALTSLQYLTYYSGDNAGSPFKLQSLIFPSSGSNLKELIMGTYWMTGDFNPNLDVIRNYSSELNLNLNSLQQLEKVHFTGSIPITITPNSFGSMEISVPQELYIDMAPYNLNNTEKRLTIDAALSNSKIYLKNINVNFAGANNEIIFINVNNKNGQIQSLGQLMGFDNSGQNNIPNLPNLTFLWLDNIPLTSNSNPPNSDIFTQCPNLEHLQLMGAPFEKLNLSNNTKLKNLGFSAPYNNYQANSNNYTSFINLKNGKNLESFNHFNIFSNTNLAICVDDINYYQNTFPLNVGYYTTNCTTTSYFNNKITGKVFFDNGSNGCTNNAIPIPNISINALHNTNNISYGTYSNSTGDYDVYVPEMFQSIPNSTISTSINNPYPTLAVLPASDSWTINSSGNTRTINFCLSGNITPEASISQSSGRLRPGVNYSHSIYLINESNHTINVNPQVTFDNAKFIYLNSNLSGTNSGNQVNWNFTLNPFEIKTLVINFNPVTTLQSGDIVTFTANLGSSYTDTNNTNNTHTINVTAVNSYDPNDKTIMQGNSIALQDVAKFLDYKIRFQNTGTAEAINVVVLDNIQPNLDISTLEVLGSSHAMRTEVIGSQVKFIFENINLDWESNNEPASHGYVDFRIKPVSTVAVNDLLENKGEIYFDYNLPIITNKTSTVIIANTTLNNSENNIKNIKIFPNPTEDKIYFKDLKNISKVNIYDVQGRLMKTSLSKDNYTDLSPLNKGIYILEIFSDGKSFKTKIIKE